jgi:hypothetical protein
VKPIGESIVGTFDEGWSRLTRRLTGLGDDEYFWEPVPGCWSLSSGTDGRWRLDREEDESTPLDTPPVTTIAWRLGHLGGEALGGFTAMRFPELATGREDDYPSNAAEVPDFLDRNYRAWRAGIAGLEEDGWQAPLGEAWGPYAESNTVDLALHVLDEVVHHAAEVGVLRDLYPHRRDLGSH